MRLSFFAAALAAMVVAAPAAAQPDATSIFMGAAQQMAQNAANVEDYTLVLSSGAMRAPVYVYQDGGEWVVQGPPGSPGGDLFETLVAWPSFGNLFDPDEAELTADQLDEIADVLSVGSATVHGRPAHVVFMRGDAMMMDSEGAPDSMRLFVDQETRQLLRVQVSSDEGAQDIPGLEGGMHITFDFAEYQETDGLTVPRRLRMEMRAQINLTNEQKRTIMDAMVQARAELGGDTSDEARATAWFMELVSGLFTEGLMEMNVTVDEVWVNSGPPEWLEVN